MFRPLARSAIQLRRQPQGRLRLTNFNSKRFSHHKEHHSEDSHGLHFENHRVEDVRIVGRNGDWIVVAIIASLSLL